MINDITQEKFETDCFTNTVLVDLCVKGGALLECEQVFDQVTHGTCCIWSLY